MKPAYAIGIAAYLTYLFAFTLAPFDLRPGGHGWVLWELSRYDLLVNLLLFIPFGVLVQGLRPAIPLIAGLLISATLSTTIEFLQSWTPQRYPSFSDVFLNLCGGGVGFVAARVARRWLPYGQLFPRYRSAIARVGLLLYLSILMFMFSYVRFSPFSGDSFFSKVHLWLWRAVPFRLFDPTQRALAFFFLFWPLGVLLAASLGTPSPVPQIRRLHLAVIALLGSIVIFSIQMTRFIGLRPFIFERVALAAALALTFGGVCGGWMNRPVQDANGEKRPDHID
jgi:hypothetical protein